MAKKILFWIMFLPIGLLMFVVGIPATIFNALAKWVDDITQKFEDWAFDRPSIEEKLAAIRKGVK
jgi:hypothetical protein